MTSPLPGCHSYAMWAAVETRRGNPLGAASLNTLSLAAAGDKFLRKFVYGKMRSNEDFKRSGRVAVWCNMKVAKNVNHYDVGNE